MRSIRLLPVLLLALPVLLFALAGPAIPAGTVIPIKLDTGLNAKKDQAGKKIEGSVMQDVDLPGGGKISARSKIVGEVVSVGKPSDLDATLVLKFDSIQEHDHTIPIKVAVLAIASLGDVAAAQEPVDGVADAEASTQWVTKQVGGDIVHRGRNKVASDEGVIGTWVEGSSVVMKLTEDATLGCPTGPGYDREQALWVFSSRACGTYDLGDTRIEKAGREAPVGEIELKSPNKLEMRGGSGWLLITAEGSQK
ncbi:MAG TPA: hypothetical protein VF753_08535 [Terriglobales bacterium]